MGHSSLTLGQVLYLISSLISFFVTGFFAWYVRRRFYKNPGLPVGLWLLIFITLFSLSHSLSMISPSENLAYFLFNLRFLFLAAIPVLWLIFVLFYTGKQNILTWKFILAIILIPAITQILIWTNDAHNLWVVKDIIFIRVRNLFFPITDTRISGVCMIVYILYSYGLMLTGFIILIVSQLKVNPKNSNDIIKIGTGAFIIILSSVFSTFNLFPGMSYNLMPQGFAISSLIIAWSLFRKKSQKENSDTSPYQPFPTGLILLSLVLIAVIISAGFLYYIQYKQHHRSDVEKQLSAIAALKANDIIQWRKERIGDGNVLFKNPPFTGLVKRFLANKDDINAHWRLSSWMNKILNSYQYKQIFLLDHNGNQRFSIPSTLNNNESHQIFHLSTILGSKTVKFLDFHRELPDSPVHLSMVVPIIDETNSIRPFGYIIMVIDPHTYLYPLIQRWPVPSSSAETYLIRKEENDVLFLNELRFKEKTALQLRFPLTDIHKPEVLAIRGFRGVVEGIDYRGTLVLAALVEIPNSPWFIVARIDKDEVIAPVRQHFWIMVIAISGTLGLTFSVMVFLWRRKNDHLISERLRAVEALRESEAFTRTILDNLPVGISVNSIRPDVSFQYMNNKFPLLYRTTREELDGDKNFWEAVYEDSEFREIIKQQVLRDCESGDTEKMFWPDVPIYRKGMETRYISARNIPLENKGLMISTVWDVTDRIKAEEQLKKSEYRYRSLFDHAPDAIFVNFEDRIIIVNNACVNLFGGHSPGNILNRSIYDFFHPDYHENIRNRISIMRSSVEPVPPIEEKIITLDGKIIDVEVSAAPFSYNETQAIHVILRDITVRKTMEKELYNSEKRLRSMLDTMMEGCQIIGFDWNYIYLNDASDRHNRRPKEELLGKNYMEMWPGIEETNVFRDIKQCLEDRVAHHFENEFIFPDGTARWFDLSILPVPEGVFIQSIDITERKQAEELLKMSEEKYRRIADTSYEGIWGMDANHITNYVNHRMADMLGYTIEEILGSRVESFMFAEDLKNHQLEMQARHSLKEGKYERRFMKKNGNELWTIVSATPIKNDKGEFIGSFGMFTDITDLKIANDAILRSEEMLRKAQEVAHVGSWKWNIKDNSLEWSDEMFRIFGIDKNNFSGNLGDIISTAIHPQDREKVYSLNQKVIEEKISEPTEYRIIWPDETIRIVYAEAGELTLDEKGNAAALTGIVQDITDRKQLESEREITVKLLKLLNSQRTLRDMIHDVTVFFHDEFDFEAVGVRLHEGMDFPYFETKGFPADFVKAENHLCSHDSNGNAIIDESGTPILACMCGNVIQGRFDPLQPFFTTKGSFFTSSTTELLANTTDSQRQARTRNRCNGEGYESVALIALRVGDITYGLLQLNDRRKGKFSSENIRLFERLADNLTNSIAFLVTQNNLLESERHYRSLFENMLNGFAYCKLIYSNNNPVDFIFLEVNKAFEKLTNRSDVENKRVTEIIPGIRDADPELFHTFDRVCVNGTPEYFESFIKSIKMWLSVSVYSPQKDYFIILFDVINERKQAEQELKLNYNIQRVLNEILSISTEKAPLNDMMQKSLMALLSLDWLSFESRGMIALYDNEQDTTKLIAHCGLSDTVLEQLKNDNWTLNDCPCQPAISSGKLMLIKGEDLQETAFFEKSDPHDHYCVPILNNGKVLGVINLFIEKGHLYNDWEADFLKSVATTLAGTIARRNAEDSLSKLNEELEKRIIERTEDLASANKELESFSYTVSHDLRAPLRHINGFLEMLVAEIDVNKNEKTSHYIDVIKQSTIRMGNLIDDLLSFSRMGRINLSMTPLNINKIFEEALSDYSDLIEKRNIKISSSPLPIAYGDKTMFRLVFSNLISNAIKFTQKTETPELHIGSEVYENENIYFVKDNGAGFDMQYADKLFGVFQRLHSDNDFEGTGIGLATIKRIINRHGGRVWANGKPGEGASFYFTLPAAEIKDITTQSEGKANG